VLDRQFLKGLHFLQKLDVFYHFKVFQNNLVDAITVGMMNPAEVDDTLKCMARV